MDRYLGEGSQGTAGAKTQRLVCVQGTDRKPMWLEKADLRRSSWWQLREVEERGVDSRTVV